MFNIKKKRNSTHTEEVPFQIEESVDKAVAPARAERVFPLVSVDEPVAPSLKQRLKDKLPKFKKNRDEEETPIDAPEQPSFMDRLRAQTHKIKSLRAHKPDDDDAAEGDPPELVAKTRRLVKIRNRMLAATVPLIFLAAIAGLWNQRQNLAANLPKGTNIIQQKEAIPEPTPPMADRTEQSYTSPGPTEPVDKPVDKPAARAATTPVTPAPAPVTAAPPVPASAPAHPAPEVVQAPLPDPVGSAGPEHPNEPLLPTRASDEAIAPMEVGEQLAAVGIHRQPVQQRRPARPATYDIAPRDHVESSRPDLRPVASHNVEAPFIETVPVTTKQPPAKVLHPLGVSQGLKNLTTTVPFPDITRWSGSQGELLALPQLEIELVKYYAEHCSLPEPEWGSETSGAIPYKALNLALKTVLDSKSRIMLYSIDADKKSVVINSSSYTRSIPGKRIQAEAERIGTACKF